jgi:hypothetical protein
MLAKQARSVRRGDLLAAWRRNWQKRFDQTPQSIRNEHASHLKHLRPNSGAALRRCLHNRLYIGSVLSPKFVALRNGTGTFEDALIGSLGIWRGCSATLTFDERAVQRLHGFALA